MGADVGFGRSLTYRKLLRSKWTNEFKVAAYGRNAAIQEFAKKLWDIRRAFGLIAGVIEHSYHRKTEDEGVRDEGSSRLYAVGNRRE